MGTDIECGHHQTDNNTSKRKAITKSNSGSSSISISAPISMSSSATPASPSPFSVVSSPSPIPIAPALSNTSKYSMEEVWKDIYLSSLHHPIKTTTTPSTGALQGILFQEFLSRPPGTRRSSRVPSQSTSHHGCRHSSFGGTDSGFFGSQRQPASTTLSLNSTPPSSLTLSHDDLHPLDSSTVEFSVLPKKRVPENEDSCHRNKRMIKNRESAARSRARKQELQIKAPFLPHFLVLGLGLGLGDFNWHAKQAYTNELENKVARLTEENAKLRRQQEKLCLDASAQFPKKHALYRTLTAPF